MKNSLRILLLASIVVWSCSPVIERFDVDHDMNGYFLKDLLPAGVQKVDVYKTTFREELVEDDDLIELTMRSENSTRDKVGYIAEQNAYRELYLFRWVHNPSDPNEPEKGATYIYFSAKFRSEVDSTVSPARERKVCLGFGPSYFGKCEVVGNHRVIRFEKNLKARPAREDGKKHFLRKLWRPRDLVAFIVNPTDFDSTSFCVSRVLYYGHNKIGGSKRLVYDVPNVLGDEEALKFKRIRSFKP